MVIIIAKLKIHVITSYSIHYTKLYERWDGQPYTSSTPSGFAENESEMEYGKARNVHFYFVTWNIYPYGTFGKYGITADVGNETTIDYYRASRLKLHQPKMKLPSGINMRSILWCGKPDLCHLKMSALIV